MRGNSVNRASGIITLILSLVLLFSTATFPDRAESAALYVRFLAVCLMLFSVIFIADTFLKSAKDKDKNRVVVWIKAPREFLIAMVSLIIYVVSLKFIGFFPASIIFMPVLGYLLGFKKKVPLILGSIGLMAFIYLVFVYLLTVPVPMGFLEGVL